jgi:protein-tyrosine phosphatase
MTYRQTVINPWNVRTMKRARPLASLLLAGLLLWPLAAQALTTPVVERTAPDKILIRWQGADPVDVYVTSRPDAPISHARRVARADTDGSAAADWTQASRPYVILKDRRDGAVARVAERLLPLERGSNFRDLGGYPAAGGKHVRWGMIYRTAATPMLTDADFAYVARLGIRSDIDLRSLEERQLAPDRLPLRTGARYMANDYPASDVFGGFSAKPGPGAANPTVSLYRSWPITLAPQFRALFQALLQGKGAVTYHCSAGQDRTGVASALVLSALGVPRDVILADYQLSTRDRRPDNEMPRLDAARYPGNAVAQFYAKAQAAGPLTAKPLYDAGGVAYLQHTFDEIDTRWGSIDAYLDQVLGVDRHAIARLRALYLE